MRTDPELQALIEEDLDGNPTPSEREALRRLLESDPVARAIYRAQREVAATLERVPSADPPSGMGDAVLRTITAARTGGPKVVPFAVRVRRAVPYLYAAAAGAAICFLSMQLLPGGQAPSDEGTTATMGARVSTLDRVTLDEGGVRGEASVRARRKSAEIALDLAVDAPCRMSLRFDPAAVEFTEFVQQEGGARAVEVSHGAVRWTQEGRERVIVRFSGKSRETSAVDVAVLRDGGEAALGRLHLPPAPAESPRY